MLNPNVLFTRTLCVLALFFPLISNAKDDDVTQLIDKKEIYEPPESPLSVNEPIYFVVGKDKDVKARFQLSFKYRLFDETSALARYTPWLQNLHFAYTQTSLWNWSKTSAPFEDSSYRPSFFFDVPTNRSGLWPTFIRTGYEHESNGQAGDLSRSIDTVILWPFWKGKLLGYDISVAPKMYGYLEKSDNEDINDYRGYVDLWLRYGDDKGWLLSTILRRSPTGNTMTQVDLSYPIRERVFVRTGGYLHLQLFQGYGESLLTYDQSQSLQVRFGFSIVR